SQESRSAGSPSHRGRPGEHRDGRPRNAAPSELPSTSLLRTRQARFAGNLRRGTQWREGARSHWHTYRPSRADKWSDDDTLGSVTMASPQTNPDLHGNAPDKSHLALVIIDMINYLEFE